ncbi:MAG: serine hydrolase [Gemmatimonadetes bacterium]|nr:serine hydrolase [Gemmatimonadota bacterium]
MSPVTRFGIASNTKVFTATALGMLGGRGEAGGRPRSSAISPQFAMYDPFVTREITIKDLLVHRSGLRLGAGDLLWWPASTSTRGPRSCAACVTSSRPRRSARRTPTTTSSTSSPVK